MDNDLERQDAPRTIDLADDAAVEAWCQELQCTPARLREAVRMVGTSHVRVEQWIRWQKLV